ncbi:MAG: SDR family NAD(P)-dependent oxidoreductase, partial [Pseudomonadota bacterium]
MQLSKDTPVIVTGGASGLGRATAEGFAAAGVPVAIFDINEEAGQDVARAIGVTFHNVNILDEESVIAGFEAARAAQGQERICVHCAMASTRGKTLA